MQLLQVGDHHAAKSDCQCAGAKKRRPDLQEHIVLILVALHEGCILEDTPKSLHLPRLFACSL